MATVAAGGGGGRWGSEALRCWPRDCTERVLAGCAGIGTGADVALRAALAAEAAVKLVSAFARPRL